MPPRPLITPPLARPLTTGRPLAATMGTPGLVATTPARPLLIILAPRALMAPLMPGGITPLTMGALTWGWARAGLTLCVTARGDWTALALPRALTAPLAGPGAKWRGPGEPEGMNFPISSMELLRDLAGGRELLRRVCRFSGSSSTDAALPRRWLLLRLRGWNLCTCWTTGAGCGAGMYLRCG